MVVWHNATHLLVQQGLALMIRCSRSTYVRYRELWVLAATAHLVWVCLDRGEALGGLKPIAFSLLLHCSLRQQTMLSGQNASGPLLCLLHLLTCNSRMGMPSCGESWKVLSAPPHLSPHPAAFNGGNHCMELAGGSPLRVVPAMLIGNSGLWMALYMLHARLLHPVNRAALPLLALPAVLSSGRLCGRMLAIPALCGPMGPAYAALDWLML